MRSRLLDLFAVALLAGCATPFEGAPASGGAIESSGAAPRVFATPLWMAAPRGPRPKGWMAPEVRYGESLIYLAGGGGVRVYRERGHNPPQVGSIVDGVDGAWGLCVDREGKLYVANRSANTVTVYPYGSVTPVATYSSSLNGPMYPIVDHDGNLFVTNSDDSRVVEYLAHQVTPHAILHPPGTESDGMAFDAAGNLYVTYRNGLYAGGIVRYAPGATQGEILPISLIQPQGLVISRAGQMLAVQTGYADGLYIFPPGLPKHGQEFGPPHELKVFATPTELVLNTAEHRIFLSTYEPIYDTGYPLKNGDGTLYRLLHRKLTFRYSGAEGMALSNAQHF